MSLADKVDAAADYISDPGRWTTHRYMDEFGRVCAFGALRLQLPSEAKRWGLCDPKDPVYVKLAKLLDRVSERMHPKTDNLTPSLARVNDRIGREAAIAVLRETAAMLRRWGF